MARQERQQGAGEILAAAVVADDRDGSGLSDLGSLQWQAAIVSLEALLAEVAGDILLLSGPSPVLADPELLRRVQAGVLRRVGMPCHYSLPAAEVESHAPHALGVLGLRSESQMAWESVCLVLTPDFGLVLVLDAAGQFRFSFAPEVVRQVWLAMGDALLPNDRQRLATVAAAWAAYPWPEPAYQAVMRFSQQLLTALEQLQGARVRHQATTSGGDAELLQALTHEVRTPLTAIRLWARLLLKRRDLPAPALPHLQGIDRECTAQIERMDLLFRAAELAARRAASRVTLQPVALGALLPDKIGDWQQIAQRQQVVLEAALPTQLPKIVSDPALLDRTLTGLLESYTAGVPNGGRVLLNIAVVGDRLKLQLSQPDIGRATPAPLRAIGRLLALHPETGSLTLNLDITKDLFRALGAKLTVRQHATQGAVLTVFLPLEVCHHSPIG